VRNHEARTKNLGFNAGELVGFARGRQGDWEAICINLDIAVQGQSFGEVQDALRAAVADYLPAVEEEPKETDREALRTRTAPISVVALWILRVTVSTWRHRRGSGAAVWAATFPILATT